MLQLTITPTSIVFENLSDEIYRDLVDNFHIEFEPEEKGGKLKVVESPKLLFKLLVKLSYKYDIEIY